MIWVQKIVPMNIIEHYCLWYLLKCADNVPGTMFLVNYVLQHLHRFLAVKRIMFRSSDRIMTLHVYSEMTLQYYLIVTGACPGGGGSSKGLGSPLEIEKQIIKKRSSGQILHYFTYILLLF